MADPTTVNVGLAIPTRGSNVGTWDTPVNNDFTALDGLFGGVQTISVSNSNVVLTVPPGFTATPNGGPTQSQNAVLRFSGALSAGVQITLPIPGFYIVENLTTGNFVLSFRAIGSGAVVGVDQGETLHLYNDGTNVKFVNLGRIGHFEMWMGLSAMPAWVTACTNAPYLLCDGTVYNTSAFPYLGARLGSSFGGNGSTTFGVPDLRGRFPLPYDGTGTRITVANSGINGQTLGAAGGVTEFTLGTSNLPPYTPSVSQQPTFSFQWAANPHGAGGTPAVDNIQASGIVTGTTISPIRTADVQMAAQGGTSSPVITLPLTQVSGIAVIRAA